MVTREIQKVTNLRKKKKKKGDCIEIRFWKLA